jgi:hypothetical protein
MDEVERNPSKTQEWKRETGDGLRFAPPNLQPVLRMMGEVKQNPSKKQGWRWEKAMDFTSLHASCGPMGPQQ